MPRKATFTVTLSGPSTVPVTVSYTTQNGTATGGASLATAGVDYVSKSGTLSFAPGEVSKTIEVSVRDDLAGAATEAFRCVLSAPINAVFPTSNEFGECVIPGSAALQLTVSFQSMVPAPAAPILKALSAVGNQFVDSGGQIVRLRGINWYGNETNNLIPLGLYRGRSYREMIDQIAGLGFNCIRFVFADDMITSTARFNNTSGDLFVGNVNQDLVGLTPMQAFTKMAQYCAEVGVRILLDHHRISVDPIREGDSGFGTDGWPTMNLATDTFLYGGSSTPRTYTETIWGSFWESLATYCTSGVWATDPKLKNVIWGFEPHNEPHNVTWNVWAGMCERLFPKVHAIAPDWMMVVGGVANNGVNLGLDDQFWWGGYFKDVRTRPVTVSAQNKVCYTPHEYGHSVSDQPWLSANAQTAGTPYPTLANRVVPNYPNNIEARRDEYWGFIYNEGIAPLFVGEFGGGFAIDAISGGADSNQTSATYEIQWMQSLVKYMNGQRNDGSSVIPVGGQGMSFAYFALNPESGNPLGGLLKGVDAASVQGLKMNLLLPLFD